MKIGIYAGTFDPIHAGHIEFAKNALKQASLDKVIIVAEKDPYRKKPHASWDHRQAMIERAAQNVEAVDHDYSFANNLARQHTMQDMLLRAKEHYGETNDFWFLVGSDIFEHIGEWKSIVQTDSYGGFVVALKHDHSPEWLHEKVSELKSAGKNINIILIDHKQRFASSSYVRQCIAEGKPLTEESISEVVDYAKAHGLYSDLAGSD